MGKIDQHIRIKELWKGLTGKTEHQFTPKYIEKYQTSKVKEYYH